MTRVDAKSLEEQALRFQSVTPRPFLRWAGSKRSLLTHVIPSLPREYNRYYEPFLGSGSLFFLLQAQDAVLNDLNQDLISTFRAVRDGPSAVHRSYAHFDVLSKDQYYAVRGSTPPKNRFERAARFLYLNRACWNGLYRVNQRGQFNVPYGAPKTASPLELANLKACSRTLRGRVQLTNLDFHASLDAAGEGDLVYLDPPYVTTHNQNGFLDYNKRIFSWKDQERLAECAHLAAARGAWVIVSNANHDDVRWLYRDFRHVVVSRNSTLASSSKARKRVSESLFWTG
ncbi:Dam family site-specific DNA-(adenine-N6)-methyltransferase [Phycicoccus endophyticus]|uniref:Site-specific DNA-methyltransferase (adenine-specific) n=1 Tax=Phycicoccus endophyticus TaxID=1690220 RepID=A0A7G9R053_9MICO|nr:Dam family site-specific DNA-(adenine-N6)-methyltransferase [Phycicoccus endophyticus]QNN48978.1 Dam family site-specific DNA-(adenine-N6)-methyltransferase [Phycicoccus endophyticus]GGL45822.1 site-specific DNA-methyltransferase (adenine-specific) [Phycicoccus endophyticus]